MKKMDSLKQPSVTPSKNKLTRTFAKIFHFRVATGIAPFDGIKNNNPPESNSKEAQLKNETLDDKKDEEDDILRRRVALEAVLAKIFASISSVKASYAQLQYAQSPYNADGIESADKLIVLELKSLSELKQSFVKKQFDASPETTFVVAEIHEQKSLLKTYEIMAKSLESHAKLQESEIQFLRDKLEELNELNRRMEPRARSGPLSVLDNLLLSGLAPNHFSMMLHHAMKSIRSFVRLMIDEMKSTDWNIDAAAAAIEPGVAYLRPDHKCFAFESFVCREMFDSFQNPNFSLPNESIPSGRFQNLFFNCFLELKPLKATEYLARNPRSTFAKFCRVKYFRLIHPKMESAFFGNLNQRNLLDSGIFPETTFFAMFGEMARRVWLLHCLAFSFEPKASIFQVSRGCRFSEVYMETVAEDVPSNNAVEYDPRVAFTVVPGFKIGEAVVQCQVFLSNYAGIR